MMNVFYENHAGERIDLNSENIILQYQEFFNYSWDAVTKNRKITGFKRDSATIPVTVAVTAETEEEYLEIIEGFYQITEKDILAVTPGKLYVDEQYLNCYISGDIKQDAFKGILFQVKNLTLVTDFPYWIKETSYQYLPEKPNQVEYTILEKGILLPEFPFDFYSEKGEKTLFNPSFKDSNFILTIYGFAENPQITIAGHPYRVETTVYEGERLVIDSIKRTVKKIGRLGDIADRYNARGKEKRVFQKIPPGTNTFQWSGGFGVDITLFDERSEPKWSL
ncbi:MAG: phage tail family protein [Bacillota bacterium]|nr:phage tail family protein [Bacillota bacterium]